MPLQALQPQHRYVWRSTATACHRSVPAAARPSSSTAITAMTAPPANRREQHDTGGSHLASLPRLPRAYSGTEVVALRRVRKPADRADTKGSPMTAEIWRDI